MAMTHALLVKAVRHRMDELNMTPYRLHVLLVGRACKQTVYNFVTHGEVIKSDTLVAIMDVLGLSIDIAKGNRTMIASKRKSVNS
jgi:hypothetical protein